MLGLLASESVGQRRPPGHLAVYCAAALGCRSVWYRPRHEPETAGRETP
jgi:hypothetical protein